MALTRISELHAMDFRNRLATIGNFSSMAYDSLEPKA
jgi:hypothetical protein